MKKLWIGAFLLAVLLVGCGNAQTQKTEGSEVSVQSAESSTSSVSDASTVKPAETKVPEEKTESASIQIEGATEEQIKTIEQAIQEAGIKVKELKAATVEKSDNDVTNSTTETLLTAFIPYDITAEDGKLYRMVIDREDMTVRSITDSETHEFVYGGFKK